MGETNIGALTSGLLKIGVAAGVATPATAVAETDYATHFKSLTATATAKDVVYQTAAGTAAPAKADALSTVYAIGFATETKAGAACVIQTSGVITITGKTFTPGLPVYISAATAGDCTQTPPATVGHFNQVVGVALTATDVLIILGPVVEVGTGVAAITEGGTGETTAQAAIDALTAVSGATNEHVLTKDTVTGNAIFKAGAALPQDIDTSDTPQFAGLGLSVPALNNNLHGAWGTTPSLDSTKFASAGLSIGTGMQNLLLRAQDFSQSDWIKTNTVVSATATAPSGLTSRSIVLAGNNVNSQVAQSVASITTGEHTFSVWLRAQSGTVTVPISLGSSGGAGGDAAVPINCAVTTVWRRFKVTQDLSTGHTTKTVTIAEGNNTIEAWGMQLEDGSDAGPAFVTGASTLATRSTGFMAIPNGLNSQLGATAGYWKYAYVDEYLDTAGTRLGTAYSAYAVGTAYSLTDTSAVINLGTTDPAIVIAKAGTYRIRGSVNLKYNASTFAANQDVTLTFYRTNNTPGALGTAQVVTAEILTTITKTMGVFEIPEFEYVTTNTNDAITIYASVAATPSAGSLDAMPGTYLTAVKVK